MKQSSDKDDFLKLPQYTGGSEAIQKFIVNNLQYPAQALVAKIEGTVLVEYKVDGLGIVSDAKVLKGIGYGCDAEALRLVKLLKFEKSLNRGLKVTSTNKIKIHFKLKNTQINLNYSITSTIKTAQTSTKPKETYGYTIKG